MKKISVKIFLFIVIVLSCLTVFAKAADNPSAVKEITVPGNLAVVLTTKDEITTKGMMVGDFIFLSVAKDLVVDHAVVIEKGAAATAVVTMIREKAPGGTPAQLVFQVTSVNTIDNQTIPVFGFYTITGKSKQAISALTTLLAYLAVKKAGVDNDISAGLLSSLPGMFIRGEDVYIPAGTEINAITQISTIIKIATV